ncbi:MAG TPA: HAD hydrolase-like protein [Bryobacteraceae bacterium]|nr:HAD hydrolase-like protein [Bryobacteraceae bacterium]
MLLIFDLDGTLIDSSEDLAISTNAARARFGLPPLSQEIVNSYVGNGAAVLVRKAMGPDASEASVAEALAYFLKFYRAHALEHTRLYGGMREAVTQLAQEHQLAVLTNKPQKISFDILASLKLETCFLCVIGGDTLAVKKPDPLGIVTLMEHAGAGADRTLMVGDSSVDISTARNASVRSCGVLWGFQPETFEMMAPDFLVDKPGELVRLIQKLQVSDDGNLFPRPGV